MNLKSTTVFLAVICSAAPALADRILITDPQNGENVSHHTQQWIHGKTSAIPFVSEDTKVDEVDVLEDSRLSTRTQARLFVFGSKEGYAFGRDNDHNAWRKHRDKGRDGGDVPTSSIAVPEPGSQLLLVFGLAGLGMFFYRRNSVMQAI